MRDILFRGKRIDNGKWVYGSLDTAHIDDKTVFIDTKDYIISKRVEIETIGQYTGLEDYAGNRIFEGDIILDDAGHIYEVFFEGGSFQRRDNNRYYYSLSPLNADTFEIIGNIYDNADLLKEGGD